MKTQFHVEALVDSRFIITIIIIINKNPIPD